VVDFLLVIIERFCYLLRLRRYKRISVEVGFFEVWCVTLSANFRRKGHRWRQKTRVIALPCGIKISAVYGLVLSQSTRVTDRQINGQTDGRTNRQNYGS